MKNIKKFNELNEALQGAGSKSEIDVLLKSIKGQAVVISNMGMAEVKMSVAGECIVSRNKIEIHGLKGDFVLATANIYNVFKQEHAFIVSVGTKLKEVIRFKIEF